MDRTLQEAILGEVETNQNTEDDFDWFIGSFWRPQIIRTDRRMKDQLKSFFSIEDMQIL